MQKKRKIKTFVSNVLDKVVGDKSDSLYVLKKAVRSLKADEVQSILNNSYYLISQQDSNKMTIMDYALKFGNLAVIKIIAEHKGKVSLSFYNAKDEKELIDYCILLKDAGYDLNYLDLLGFAPIHYASMYNYHELMKFLLSNGADIGAVDINGSSPIILSLDKKKGNNFLVRGHC